MADSIIDNDSEPGGDGWLLTRLAKSLGRRVPLMCLEKLFHDGRQIIPTMNIPAGVDQRSYEIYKRYTHLGRIDLASPIVGAAVDRQRPTGFRRTGVSGTDARADDMYADCRLQLQIPRACAYVGWYGQAFWLVAKGRGRELVQLISPWQAQMSDDEDSACVYDYDEASRQESLTLLRLVRDSDGDPSQVYSRRAVRKSDHRTLVRPDDTANVEKIGDSYDADNPSYWDPGNGWSWAEDPDTADWDYATTCGHIPLFRQTTGDGQSLIAAHIPTLERIDTGIFDRMCIISMQAFRQRAIVGLNRTVYTANDPEVQSGRARAGQQIDFSKLFSMGPAALWMLPKDATIWESQTTDTQQLVQVETSDIKKLAIASSTPLDILSPDVQGSASGADLKREGLVFKVERLNDLASDALTGAVQMALVLDGDPQAVNLRLEMTWAPIKVSPVLTQAQAAQAAKGSLPVKTQWRLIWGMTDAQIQQAEQDMMDTTFQTALSMENDALKGSAGSQLGSITPDNPYTLPGVAQAGQEQEQQPAEKAQHNSSSRGTAEDFQSPDETGD